jgi:aromatic-L-amino-acid/L-tryptophan decarboxylase
MIWPTSPRELRVAPGGWPLEPEPEAMHALAEAATAELVAFVRALPERPASDTSGVRSVLDDLPHEPPETPGDPGALLALVSRAAAHAWESAGPGYLAFIPGGGLFTSAVADFLANGLNRYTAVAATAPGLVALEARLLGWLCEEFGLPASAQGLLTTGGSMANFMATVAARADRLDDDPALGVVYVSEQAHVSVAKAARLAGIPGERVRKVPCTDDLRLDPEALARAVSEDQRRGLRPFLVVANAGTTNTGTIDPLPAIASVAAHSKLWLHVDAAYGGFFWLTERGRRLLTGLDLADSIALDPHKGLFLPYGTGCLLVRDRRSLADPLLGDAPYMRDLTTPDGLPDFATMSPELSRDFRGLRLWLPLHVHGLGAFRTALDEKLDLARLVYQTLAADPRLETPYRPELSVVTFRLPGDDRANNELLSRINGTQRVALSSTTVRGQVFLRVAILSHRTHRDRIDELLAIVDRATEECLRGHRGPQR